MKPNSKYCIHVECAGNYDPAFDKKLERLLRKQVSESMYGFGYREIIFEFKRMDTALRAFKKLSRFRSKIRQVRLGNFLQ